MLKQTIFILLITISNLYFALINKNKKSFINILLIIISVGVSVFKSNLPLFTIIFLTNSIINIIMNKNILKEKYKFKQIIFILYILFNISVLLEITVFNYKTYFSLGNKEIKISEKDIKTNLEKIDNDIYLVPQDRPYIEIKNVNKHIKNAYIDIQNYNDDHSYIITFFTDEANKLYTQIESKEVHNEIDRSKILTYNFSGKTKKIKFEFTFLKGNKVKINNIILNYKIPLSINIIRILLAFSILSFIYLFRIKSFLHEIKYVDNRKKIIAILILLSIFTYAISSYNSLVTWNKDTTNIYNRMADSLLEGKTYFASGNNSEEILKTLDNPYDTQYRIKVFERNNSNYLWDCAYYKGKYYSYFGVVPVVMFFIPYKLFFNKPLQTPILILFIGIISALLLVLLLDKIVKKYFKNCSVAMFLLLGLTLIYCTGIMHFLKLPTLYTLPIATGLMFSYLGLNLLVSCLINIKHSNLKVLLGSLSLALVAGCRPQLLLGSLFFIPIIYLYIKEYGMNRKDIIAKIIVIVIPYTIIAILLMYYNYIRFSSPFDFGANYNLTTNDMTHRGFVFNRIPLGLVLYLFNPVNIKNTFPYIIETPLSTNYLGTTIYESMYGGIFFSTIITSINLFIFKLKKYINSKVVFLTSIGCILSSIIIIIADTEMAGLLARYFTDFSWILVFSSVLIILALNESNLIHKRIFIKIIVTLVAISLMYQFFYYFVSINDQFKYQNIRLWLEYSQAIQFWL